MLPENLNPQAQEAARAVSRKWRVVEKEIIEAGKASEYGIKTGQPPTPEAQANAIAGIEALVADAQAAEVEFQSIWDNPDVIETPSEDPEEPAE